MDSTTMARVSSVTNDEVPFFALPSLVRDEILSHLLPPSGSLWLVRPAAFSGGWNHAAVALAEQHFEYYNAFWRRRQIE
jgi:hypothetical protein